MSESDKDIKEENTTEPFFSIKVLHISNDDTSKTFGELLKNKSSRHLMEALKEKQMYVNQMHKEQEMRVSLVSHHLNKLIELGFLNITEKQISKKTKDHRFFELKHDAYLILIEKEETQEIHNYSILKKIFKESVKLSCVGIAGISAWFSIDIIQKSRPIITRGSDTVSSDLLESLLSSNILLPLLFTGLIVGFGLFILYKKKIKKD